MNVEMPDGTIIEDVPDGTTKEQVLAKYRGSQTPALSPQVTMQDRGQAFAAGVNRGTLANIPGLPVDTALNVWDLLKAGVGSAGKATGLLKTEQMPQMTDRSTIPMSSEWLANKIRSTGIGIDPNAPEDRFSRLAYAGGQGTAATALGGPRASVPAAARDAALGAVTQVAGQGTAEMGGGPAAQVLASFAPAIAGPMLFAAGQKGVQQAQVLKEQNAQRVANIKATQDAGFVFPPSLINPTVLNKAVGGISGKAATEQQASINNQKLAQVIARQAVGLPENAPLNFDTLAGVRKQAGTAYEAVRNTGTVTPGAAYGAALDAIVKPYEEAAKGFPDAKPSPIIGEINALRSPKFDAGSAVDKISELRQQADTAYASGNKAMGRAYKQAADVLENELSAHLKRTGADPQLIANFQTARQTIAKTYSLQSALNPMSEGVDARKLFGQAAKGKMLSGGLDVIAKAGGIAPMSARDFGGQTPPGISVLDWALAGGPAIAGLVSGHPEMAASMAWPLARIGARKLALSAPYQRHFASPPDYKAGLLARIAEGSFNPDPLGLLGAYTVPQRQQ